MNLVDGHEALLALMGIDEPNERQRVGALLVTECIQHINIFFGGGKK